MALELRQQRDGKLRPYWYGVYTENEKRKVINLNVLIKGTPPASLKVSDIGDKAFEKSRIEAEIALAAYQEEAQHKGRADHLTERLIESKTGEKIQYSKITDLPQLWRNIRRKRTPNEKYLSVCDSRFKKFADFINKRNSKAVYLYEVRPSDIGAFMQDIEKELSYKTVQDIEKMLRKAFYRFLPHGSVNPFEMATNGHVGNESKDSGDTIHRKPFTPDELTRLLDTARNDDFMFPLITAAICTGLRKADICRLKWRDIDFKEKMIAVKTSKTGADVEIPLFLPLSKVLEAQKKSAKGEYVFPQAMKMMDDNPDGLTLRFKKIVAKAFDAKPAALKECVSPADVEAEGLSLIKKNIAEGARRDRMIDTFKRYCAGLSFRAIQKETGYFKSQISGDLHTVQDLLGKPFLFVQTPSTRATIARLTRIPPGKDRQRSASIYDWHALRSTFVTLALSADVPMELVRRITGHATVEIVLKHYFRPGREQFRAVLNDKLPEILTGKKPQITPQNELMLLAQKVADNTATKSDRIRFKKLAKEV